MSHHCFPANEEKKMHVAWAFFFFTIFSLKQMRKPLICLLLLIVLVAAVFSKIAISGNLFGGVAETQHQPISSDGLSMAPPPLASHVKQGVDGSSGAQEKPQEGERKIGGGIEQERQVRVADPSAGPNKTKVIYEFIAARTTPSSFLTVKGLPIEAIEARQRVADSALLKSYKFLLPQVESSLPKYAQRVWIDLGARMFPKGSTAWFLQRYPQAASFRAEVFELLDLRSGYGVAIASFRNFTYHAKAAWVHSQGVTIKGRKMAKVADGIESIRNDKRAEWRAPSADMAEFLKSNFKLDDFVVLKMDIEGGEWTLIPHLQRTGAIDYVDEFFFECHPTDFALYHQNPAMMPQMCLDFINDLRARGVYTHRWL